MDKIIINYWSVLVAAVAYIVIGVVWYGTLFKKRWMRLEGLNEEKMRSMNLTAVQATVLGFVTALIMSYVLARFVSLLDIETFADGGWGFAFWAWLGLIIPVSAGKFLWEGKSFSLFVLNAANQLVSIVIMVLILVSWR